jgi:hypothetical protein
MVVSRSVSIPSSFHGKIIGKKAATKLDIESDYGVKLFMPDRNSPSQEIRIEGPTKTAVDAAEHRILDICGMGKDPDRSELDRLHAEKGNSLNFHSKRPIDNITNMQSYWVHLTFECKRSIGTSIT